MDYQETALLDYLLSTGKLTEAMIDTLKIEAVTSGKSLTTLLVEKRLVDERGLAEAKAKVLGIPYFAESKISVEPDLIGLISVDLARTYQVVPYTLDKQNKTLSLIMVKPEELSTVDFFQKRTGYTIKSLLTSKENLDTLIANVYSQSLSGEISSVLKRGKEVTDEEGVRLVTSDTISQIIKEPKIVEIVRKILEHAIRLRASDIHIEPMENITRVRYRIDGILEEKLTLDKDYHASLISRIKILAGMKIDEKRIPQDGRFNFQSEWGEVDLRISSLPTVNGEKIVMRLLKKTDKVPSLSELGLRGKALTTLEEAIRIPHGIILATGPTGSGKTTTLYSILTMVNSPKVNIVALEDPVEYQIGGVNQVQINPQAGLTFASGLRSFLRQDPNIIMVGEIRDNETMEIALHAAMTGHLVLSTLHTNSAAGALPRLLDMGAEHFLVASTVNVIIAQRLVRKLCPECKQEYKMDKKEVKTLEDNFDIKTVLEYLKVCEQTKGFVKKDDNWEDIRFYKAKGCDQCGNEGFHGRVGIYEVLDIDPDIEKLITQSASTETIEKKAMENGMSTMIEDGLSKAVQGLTTIEEIMRVTKE